MNKLLVILGTFTVKILVCCVFVAVVTSAELRVSSSSLNVTFGEHFGKIGFSPIKNGTVELDKRIWLYMDELIFIQFPPNEYYTSYSLSSLSYTITDKKDGNGIYIDTFIPNFGNFSLSLVFFSRENTDEVRVQDCTDYSSKDALSIEAYVNTTERAAGSVPDGNVGARSKAADVYPILSYWTSDDPCKTEWCNLKYDLATIQHANYTLGIYSHNTYSWEAVDVAGNLRMFSGLFYYSQFDCIYQPEPPEPPEPPQPPVNQESPENLAVFWVLFVLFVLLVFFLLFLLSGFISKHCSKRQQQGEYTAANQVELVPSSV